MIALDALHRDWSHRQVWSWISAAVITAMMLGGAYGEAHPTRPSDRVLGGHHVPHTPDAALVLVGIAGVALFFRRNRPVPALLVSVAAVLAYTALGYVNGAALLGPTFALYAVCVQTTFRRALAWGVAVLAVLLSATAATNPFGPTGGGFELIPFLMAVACAGGIAVANRRAYAASLVLRAEGEARRQVDEERLRIARELHDVVAHTMATINVQAGVAAHLLADRPGDPAVAPAREALATIKAASKEGLAELRSILRVLRQADEADTTHPAPGIGQLDMLVNGARRAGLDTVVTVVGERRPLPAAVDLAAYRIVQESLTNAIRHAGTAAATVELSYGPDGLRVEVNDTGRGRAGQGPAEGTGHGIPGMRERAAGVGGTLDAGPHAGGGFRVAAYLPTPSGDPPEAVREPAGQGQPA